MKVYENNGKIMIQLHDGADYFGIGKDEAALLACELMRRAGGGNPDLAAQVQAIDSEVAWCKENGDGEREEFVNGFIDGLLQAKNLLVLVNSVVNSDADDRLHLVQ